MKNECRGSTEDDLPGEPSSILVAPPQAVQSTADPPVPVKESRTRQITLTEDIGSMKKQLFFPPPNIPSDDRHGVQGYKRKEAELWSKLFS